MFRSTCLTALPPAACILTGWALWRLFDGGILGSDGEWQIHQAMAGAINDWLPPVMTALIRQSLLILHGVAPLVLVQSILGCLGIFHAALAIQRFAFPARFSPRIERCVALGVLFLLLIPLSPLAYYLVFIQSDGWLLPGLAWSVAGWLNLEITREYPEARRTRLAWWLVAILGSAWTVLMRHNAVVLLPVFAALAAVAARPQGRIAAAVLVVVLPLAVGAWVKSQCRVESLHPEDQIIALDLVGLCVEHDELREELPYTNRHLLEDRFREQYVPGFVNPFYWYHPEDRRPTKLDYVGEAKLDGTQQYGSRHGELIAEYRTAIRRAPVELALVKWTAFRSYAFSDHIGEQWHHTAILSPRYGITPRPVGSPVREQLHRVDDAVASSPVLRFVCANHTPWLVANAVFLIVAGTAAWRGSRRARFIFLMLCLPAVYYASHLPAVAGPWYRYMYPATLLVQLGSLVMLANTLHAAAVHTRRWLNTARRADRLTVVPSGGA